MGLLMGCDAMGTTGRGEHQQRRQRRRRFPHCLQSNLPVESFASRYWGETFLSIVRLSQALGTHGQRLREKDGSPILS